MTQTSVYAVQIADDGPPFHITLTGISGQLVGEDWVSTISPRDPDLERSLTWLCRQTGCPTECLRRAVSDARVGASKSPAINTTVRLDDFAAPSASPLAGGPVFDSSSKRSS